MLYFAEEVGRDVIQVLELYEEGGAVRDAKDLEIVNAPVTHSEQAVLRIMRSVHGELLIRHAQDVIAV